MLGLHILFFLAGTRDKASSRVRGFWIAEELTRQGSCRSTIVVGRNKRAFLTCLALLPLSDVVYFQKCYGRWNDVVLKLATLLGKCAVFDLDDAPFGPSGTGDFENSVIRMMTRATAVVVGSQNLLEYAKRHQAQSFYLPSSIKLQEYPLTEPQDGKSSVCLGWVGHGGIYRRDLIEILPEPLKAISSRYQIRLKLIGVCQQQELYQTFSHIPGLETIFIDSLDWTNQSEVHREMSDIDIGLYPLLDTAYNTYKCGFKALEYMALGIPVVLSPVGANTDVVRHGVDGYHAGGTEEWVTALSALVEDSQLRITMGQTGRQHVEASYNISGTARKLAKIMGTLKKNSMMTSKLL